MGAKKMEEGKAAIIIDDEGEEEMEAAIQASLESFEREASTATKKNAEVIDLAEDKAEEEDEEDARATALLQRVAELQERNELLRQKLLLATSSNTEGGANTDDELEMAIQLSFQQPLHTTTSSPSTSTPTTTTTQVMDTSFMQGAQDVDRLEDGSTFLLNRIRGLPASGNENTVTFKQILQAVGVLLLCFLSFIMLL